MAGKTAQVKMLPSGKRGGKIAPDGVDVDHVWFAWHFVACSFNATEAFKRTYPNKDSVLANNERVIWQQSSQLLKQGTVQRAIARITDDYLSDVVPEAHKVLKELCILAHSDIKDHITWGDDGVQVHSMEEMGEATKAIKKMKIRSRRDTDANGNTIAYADIDFELHDKVRALERIGNNLGLWRKEGEGGPVNPRALPAATGTGYKTDLSNRELKNRILRLLTMRKEIADEREVEGREEGTTAAGKSGGTQSHKKGRARTKSNRHRKAKRKNLDGDGSGDRLPGGDRGESSGERGDAGASEKRKDG